MTRLRQIAMAGLAAIAIGGVASSASAEEFGTFENRLAGATIGLPLGAAPPPGLYTGLETAYLGMANGGGNGGRTVGNWCIPTGGVGRLRKPARGRPGGTAALGAGLELVGRYLFGLGGAGFLRVHDVRCGRKQWQLCRRRSDHKRRLCVHQYVLEPDQLGVESGWRLVRVRRLQLYVAERHASSRYAEPGLLDLRAGVCDLLPGQ